MLAYRAGLIFLMLGLAAPSYAEPAQGGFTSEANLHQNFSYDSNPLRQVSGGDSLIGSTTSPELILRKKTPLVTLESDTRIDANMFNHSEFNSVDLHQKLLLSKQNQRWTASVRGLLDYDTTRTSELTNYALNLPRVNRTQLSAKPQITFRPNAQDSISLNAGITSVTYDNSAYTDYRTYSIGPAYEHRFDPDNRGTIAFNVSRYETTNNSDLTSDSYGPSLGWITILSPRMAARVNAGLQSTEKSGTNAGSDSSSWNYVFSGNLAYKGDVDILDFTAIRARQPFGNGTETLLTTFKVREQHAINPSLSLTAEAMHQVADYSTEPGINLDHGSSAAVGLSYQWYKNVALTANYKYRNEDLTNVNGSVDQHIVMLGFSVQPAWSGE